jgi:predicted Fe-Mo cluster-binding NifX family protein
MKVALPIWDDRVSPVFDVAHELLVTDVNGQAVGTQATHVIAETDAAARAKTVADLGVTVLICGAISQALEQLLLSRGVRVIPRKYGDAHEVLTAHITRRLDEPQYTMPGCQADAPPKREGTAAGGRFDADDEWTCRDQVEVRLHDLSEEDTGTSRCWIAEVGPYRVGELLLHHDRTEGWVRQFDVQPRWQHSPVPCRLIQQALSYCRRLGLIKITIETQIRSRRAWRLIECLGFQRNHRDRPEAHDETEFYLNLYRAIDEAQCASETNGAVERD